MKIVSTLYEAPMLFERWRVKYNTRRPRNSLGYWLYAHAPKALEPLSAGSEARSVRFRPTSRSGFSITSSLAMVLNCASRCAAGRPARR